MSTLKSNFHTRREFLKKSLGLVAAASTVPTFLSRTAFALANPFDTPLVGASRDNRILLVVQLGGGNDGVNTVIPFGHDGYYRARPTLAVPEEKVVRLNEEIGLHPSLAPLKALYDAGKLAVVQGVGYPNPDRSHFRSMEIWQSGMVEDFESTGWIGRMFDHTCNNKHLKEPCSPTLAVSIGETLNPAIKANNAVGVALRDPEQFYRMTQVYANSDIPSEEIKNKIGTSPLDFLRRTAMNAELSADRIRRSIRSVQSKTAYPADPFAQGLKLIAAMIAGNMDTRVYYISLTGFDTHANQAGVHERLLKILADGLAAFQKDLEALGVAERVLGFTFSEFGRRLAENGSRGTDHGQAAPMFVFGHSVQAGIVGPHPSLEKLNDGDLAFHTDFRHVYATALEKWLGADSSAILGQKFILLPLVS
ncbi:DUF1501 domain-containing protein [candidate division KSB1 bacterium]|nr:DUF1501 domain-containing protein [candidate division KSB1 bacterium]